MKTKVVKNDKEDKIRLALYVRNNEIDRVVHVKFKFHGSSFLVYSSILADTTDTRDILARMS